MPTDAPKPLLERLRDVRVEVDHIVRDGEMMRNRKAEWEFWVSASASLYTAELYAMRADRMAKSQ